MPVNLLLQLKAQQDDPNRTDPAVTYTAGLSQQ